MEGHRRRVRGSQHEILLRGHLDWARVERGLVRAQLTAIEATSKEVARYLLFQWRRVALGCIATKHLARTKRRWGGERLDAGNRSKHWFSWAEFTCACSFFSKKSCLLPPHESSLHPIITSVLECTVSKSKGHCGGPTGTEYKATYR